VWTVRPGHQPVARQIRVLNLQTCQFTLPTVLQAAPTGPGYCTLVAPVEANPTYNFSATPAPRPTGVVASVGEDCESAVPESCFRGGPSAPKGDEDRGGRLVCAGARRTH
jgi:hypothetical protein